MLAELLGNMFGLSAVYSIAPIIALFAMCHLYRIFSRGKVWVDFTVKPDVFIQLFCVFGIVVSFVVGVFLSYILYLTFFVESTYGSGLMMMIGNPYLLDFFVVIEVLYCCARKHVFSKFINTLFKSSR